jgi:hypothetical protein
MVPIAAGMMGWIRRRFDAFGNQSLTVCCIGMAVDAWQRIQDVYRRYNAGAVPAPEFGMDQGQHVCSLRCGSICIEGQTLEVHACHAMRAVTNASTSHDAKH